MREATVNIFFLWTFSFFIDTELRSYAILLKYSRLGAQNQYIHSLFYIFHAKKKVETSKGSKATEFYFL